MNRSEHPIGEFDLIARYLAPLAAGNPAALGLSDDAAVFSPPPGKDLVVTKDMMVADIHFLSTDPPDLIARKLLRVNLSDLAAMGARPYGYLLGLALPTIDESWLAAFCSGLGEDQEIYAVHLLGGDTVSTPGPMVLSLTALGTVVPGGALKRSGATVGDCVFVTGTIGDAALGLKAIQGTLADGEEGAGGKEGVQSLIERYRLPQPRLDVGYILSDFATAAADISDGLVADLGHICDASGVGAFIREEAVPLSTAAEVAVKKEPGQIVDILTGGDDYELVFTASADQRAPLAEMADRLGIRISEIGAIEAGSMVNILNHEGQKRALAGGGFTHF